MNIPADQVRKARGLLGWSQIAFAIRSSVAYARIAQYETGHQTLSGGAIAAIRQAFEAAGVEFDDQGHVVRSREDR